MSLNGRCALVVGFGRSGRASASFIQRQGGRVRVVDRADSAELKSALKAAGVEGRLGGYSDKDLEGVDLVVVSPGVPWDSQLLETARRQGIAVTSEIDLFFAACRSPIVGITGTNGKTTTTALAAEVLRGGGLSVMRGGNIGETVLDRLDQLRPATWVVLELSSFQLESITRPRLRVGVVLNVTPDHLDRHKSFERYVEIKARAVAFMQPGDHAVLNVDDPVVMEMKSRVAPGAAVVPFSTSREWPGVGVTVSDGHVRLGGEPVFAVKDVPLPGEHNLSNVLAAIGVGYAAGVEPDRMAQAVRAFAGVEHRLELVGTYGGARWYNDSKATNPDSTYKALAAFSEPIVLIAGGRNKGIDLEPLAAAIAGRAAALIAIGETGNELADRVRARGLEKVWLAADLQDAVRRARTAARPGDVVLLSPAFASYDMFKDFEDRGRQFKAAVRKDVAP